MLPLHVKSGTGKIQCTENLGKKRQLPECFKNHPIGHQGLLLHYWEMISPYMGKTVTADW